MTPLKDLLLGPPRLTLAVAESLTCGHVQARAGAHAGASEFFLGGITAYSLEQKVMHLGVDRDEAERSMCVSAAVAEQMATGACALFGSDLAVATTGWAEPVPLEGIETPYAWWALAHVQRSGGAVLRSGRIEVPGASRTEVQGVVADTVMEELTRYLVALRR